MKELPELVTFSMSSIITFCCHEGHSVL